MTAEDTQMDEVVVVDYRFPVHEMETNEAINIQSETCDSEDKDVFDFSAVIAAASERIIDWTDSESEADLVEPTSPAPVILVTDYIEPLDDDQNRKDTDEGGFTLVDFSIPTREKPISHPGVDPPICEKCKYLELSFFDPTCSGCREILINPKTSISELFAIMRQWVPQTQQNIDLLVKEVLRRGAHISDKDGLTDMTMLHYACKAGAAGVGDLETAKNVVQMLISKGAKIDQKCRWTDMLPLHYATFFDVGPVVKLLLEASRGRDTDTSSSEFDNGTPLHIAASNLCLDAAQVLLRFGANIFFKDGVGRTPLQCVPELSEYEYGSEGALVASELRKLLQDAEESCVSAPVRKESLSLATLRALGLAIGDRVTVADKVGILRFCGSTDFASGQWAGVELEEPAGKNDGEVAGVRYFTCKANHGLFAPLSKISYLNPHGEIRGLSAASSMDISNGTPRIEDENEDKEIRVGDRVIVAGQKCGTVRFAGSTKFASGHWIGVELDQAAGKNDGSVAGVRYFTCKTNYGVFAPPSKVQRSHEGGNRKFSIEHVLEEKSDVATPGRNGDVTARAPSSKGVSSPPSQIPVAVGMKGRHSSADSTDLGEKSNPVGDPKVNTGKQDHGRVSSSVGKSSDFQTPKSKMSRSPGSARSASPTLSAKRPKETSSSSKHANLRLKEGMSVYVNNELGIVRFIGRVEFAEGVWLGVELRKPSGKNDGMVGEKRYFSCKPCHGLMVRPSRATCRGINCSQLVGDR